MSDEGTEPPEYTADVTDAEKIAADGLGERPSLGGHSNPDEGRTTDAEKIAADGLDEPPSVGGRTNRDERFESEAEKIDADGLD